MKPRERFSQRHPLLFGFMLLMAAMVLFAGIMAAFGSRQESTATGERLGVVNVTGIILESRKLVDWIEELRKDETIKGVLLRIESPGGAIAPSQEIFRAVQGLAAEKPVVASYGSVAASGGYYVSLPCTEIWANPGSMTASIGVKMDYLNFADLVRELGVKRQLIASGPNKGAGSPFEDLTAEQRAMLQSMVDDMYAQFVADVARARGMDVDAVTPLADGRPMTGSQALSAGLVDGLGGRLEALARLRELAGAPEDAELVEGPAEQIPLLDQLLGISDLSLLKSLEQPLYLFTF